MARTTAVSIRQGLDRERKKNEHDTQDEPVLNPLSDDTPSPCLDGQALRVARDDSDDVREHDPGSDDCRQPADPGGGWIRPDSVAPAYLCARRAK